MALDSSSVSNVRQTTEDFRTVALAASYDDPSEALVMARAAEMIAREATDAGLGPPDLTASPAGTVHLEWYEAGRGLEMWVGQDASVEFLATNGRMGTAAYSEREGAFPSYQDREITALIAWVAGG
jgi:hypothetical protein